MSETRIIKTDDTRVNYLSERDTRLGKLIYKIGNLEYRLKDNPYRFLVETIIGQLISVKAADAIVARLNLLCNNQITPQNIEELSAEEIASVGTSLPKARYIKGITEAVLTGQLDFEALEKMDANVAMKELKKIKGIGDWTAKMYGLSFLDGADILPVSDVAFMRACKWFFDNPDIKPKEVEELRACWKPYSSVATRYLYACLGSDLIKNKIDF